MELKFTKNEGLESEKMLPKIENKAMKYSNHTIEMLLKWFTVSLTVSKDDDA